MSGGLFYTMTLNAAQFTGPMQKANKETNTLKSSMGGLLGMGTKLAGMLAALGAGAAAFAAVKKGMTLAADFEKTEVGMNTIIKDLQVTKGLIRELQALAASTPLELPELTGAARSMLGGGWKLGDIIKDLRTMGDVAAGAQTDLEGIVTIVNQVKGKGKLLAEELQQFAERGVSGLREALAKAVGVSVAQLFGEMEKGNVTAEHLMDAFREMAGKSGNYFQGMQKQAKTTYGLLSTLNDSINQIYLAFSLPLNDSIKPALEKAIELADWLAARAKDTVGMWIKAWGDGKLGTVIWAQFKWAMENVINLGAATFGSLAAGVQHVFRAFTTNVSSIEGLWTTSTTILKNGMLYAAAAFREAIVDIFIELNQALPGMMKMLGFDADNAKLQHFKTSAQSNQLTHMANMRMEFDKLADSLNKGMPEVINSLFELPKIMSSTFEQFPKIFDAVMPDMLKEYQTWARLQRNKDAAAEIKAKDERSNPKKKSPLDYLKTKGLDVFKAMKEGGSPLDYLKSGMKDGKKVPIGNGFGVRALTLREREQSVNGAARNVVARVKQREKEDKDELKKANGHLQSIDKKLDKLNVR